MISVKLNLFDYNPDLNIRDYISELAVDLNFDLKSENDTLNFI